jgi:hypothetical protein
MRPISHQVMNISQPERGGNGESPQGGESIVSYGALFAGESRFPNARVAQKSPSVC